MSKARMLSPDEVKKLHPAVYDIFFEDILKYKKPKSKNGELMLKGIRRKNG